MEEINKEMKRALLLCLPFLIVVFFLDNLDKFFASIHSTFGNPLLVLTLIIVTIIIIILFIDSAMLAWNGFREFGFKALAPFLICTIALANSQWSPLRISSENFASKIVHIAYMRDQYGHSILKMRENHHFEIRYPGPLAISDWEYGEWERRADTFYLHFNPARDPHNLSDHISDTMVLDSIYLHPVLMSKDTFKLYKEYLFKMAGKNKYK
jgi:tryptophan-rich sensory protein